MMRQRDQIDELTGTLRRSGDPIWVRLRTLLRERAVDPDKSLLVEFFPDDSQLYFGIVITQDKQAIQFDLEHDRRPITQAGLSSWDNITGLKSSPHAGIAEAGIFRLEREGDEIL